MIRVADEVSNAHPALPGHFPGNPIVPGVLLLASVSRAIATAFHATVAAVPAVKFMAPLRPGERFDVELDPPDAEASVRFRILRGPTLIAAGVMRLRETAAPRRTP